MAKFGIIATYRVGSTLLKDSFDKHCLNEIFGHDYYLKMNPKLSGRRNAEPLNYLEYHLNKDGEPIMGAKIMVEQLSKDALFKILKSAKFKKILLVRENLTEMAVSYAFMCHIKQTILFDKDLYKDGIKKIPYAHGLMGTKLNVPKPFKMDISTLEKRCLESYNTLSGCEKELNKHGNYIKVKYEDMVANNTVQLDVINKCRTFVGLPALPEYNSPLKKMADEDVYKKCITNYDEINKKLGDKFGVLFSNKTPTIWR